MHCLRFLDKGKDFVPFAEFKPKNGKCEWQIKPKIPSFSRLFQQKHTK